MKLLLIILFPFILSAQTYTASGLSTNVNAGSYVNAYLLTNNLATNPTTVVAGITFWFVRRQ